MFSKVSSFLLLFVKRKLEFKLERKRKSPQPNFSGPYIKSSVFLIFKVAFATRNLCAYDYLCVILVTQVPLSCIILGDVK